MSSGGGEKVGWEGWESEQVGLTTLVQSPDVITLGQVGNNLYC